jgi:outer membrane protein OmpA-like peptidoglycan-associated protein
VTAHKLVLRANRLLFSVEYTITGDDGAILGRGTFEPKDAGNRLDLTWRQKPGKVLKIELLAKDADDFTERLTLFPWHWSIPHEEVVFASGHSDITKTERPKLDRSWRLLQQGLAKYGKLMPIRLYIAGYTDTVADSQYNQRLSEQRARSIAAYFRAKGFNKPIFYQGFGERALKVATPDETDEPQTRRAEYVLAAEPPPVDVPGADKGWKKLER